MNRQHNRRTESAQGDWHSADRNTIDRREKWSEETVLGEDIVPENLDTMSSRNRDKGENRKEAEEEDVVPQPLTTATSGRGWNDMVLLMQMWMKESKRKEEAWSEK